MNDNNDFVIFVFMVLFRKISKQNHENACYAVIIL